MKINNLISLKFFFGAALPLGTILIASMPSEAVMFRSPGKPAPSQSVGGASRGECFSENRTIDYKSLLPKQEVGLTIAERPTLFVYVPQTSAEQVLLTIRNGEDNSIHYRTYLPLTVNGGVVSITIPEDSPALELEKDYIWSLQIVCHEDDPAHPETIGWIRRVTIENTSVSPTEPASLEKVSELAYEGIWYDALSNLASLRQAQPEDQVLISDWQELLTSAGLDDLATQPLKY